MSVAFFGVLLLRVSKIKSTDSVQNFSTKYGKIIDTCKCFLLEGYLKAISKNSMFRINKRVFFETFACVDFVDVAIARKS